MLRKLGKKAGVEDYIMYLVIVFFLAVSFLVVAYTTNIIKEVITDTALNDTIVAPVVADRLDDISTKTIQRGFVVLIAFLAIGMMVSAFLIRMHPAFLFIYIIFISVALFTAAPLANTYQDITEVTAFVPIAAQQTMMNYIMEHLVVIMLAVGALSMVVTFSKIFGGGGGTQATGDIG